MSSRCILFGDCAIDILARVLRKGGHTAALEPKAFDCLAYLIEQRARAVGRDELIGAVWGKADVTDAMLGQVRKLCLREGICEEGAPVVVVAGVPLNIPGNTNLMSIHRV